DKAVVLVAPFPNYQVYENDRTIGTLASVLPSLASALINQARLLQRFIVDRAAVDRPIFERTVRRKTRIRRDDDKPSRSIDG
ncbi:hypothetical protein, partial [Bradyrhizobium uaiense]|uniref:hypothetical protein n=1 Tax=Bradyrhizobium uaiense TaxID=2594946 RepID=UPI0013D1C5F2